jgi:hypothetical protein
VSSIVPRATKRAPMLKMWIGNFDGQREALIIATSKKRACEITHTGRKHFDDYWVEQDAVDPNFKPETLYTRPMLREGRRAFLLEWFEGLCKL